MQRSACPSLQVDDVFFVLARCGRRALGTASAACVCAVLGQANALLGSAVSPHLRSKLEVNMIALQKGDVVAELRMLHNARHLPRAQTGHAMHNWFLLPCRMCRKSCCKRTRPVRTTQRRLAPAQRPRMQHMSTMLKSAHGQSSQMA